MVEDAAGDWPPRWELTAPESHVIEWRGAGLYGEPIRLALTELISRRVLSRHLGQAAAGVVAPEGFGGDNSLDFGGLGDLGLDLGGLLDPGGGLGDFGGGGDGGGGGGAGGNGGGGGN